MDWVGILSGIDETTKIRIYQIKVTLYTDAKDNVQTSNSSAVFCGVRSYCLDEFPVQTY